MCIGMWLWGSAAEKKEWCVPRKGAEIRKAVPLGQGWKARVDVYGLRAEVDAFSKSVSHIASVRKLQPEELEVEKQASYVEMCADIVPNTVGP